MGGAVSSGRDNNELIDNLMGGNYIRTRMVERVFRSLDRADYMTPEARDQAYKDLAWRNGPLHLSAPCIYSEVLEGLELKPGLSFLNVGSGTGYFSTMAGLILGSGGINHGVEVHPYVLEYAVKKLSQFIENSPTLDEFDFCEPRFYSGNGLCIAPLQTPYDRVYCGAGCPEEYQNYFKQLIKVGGILVMPLNDNLVQIKRVSVEEWTSKNLLNVSFATLRVPTKEESADLIRLEEQCPPRLQVLARASVRESMRTALLSRNPHLRPLPSRRPVPSSSCPRRICIPIEDDSDNEGLNALHDLDNMNGANEMNALLSLVLSMGQNRVAGALRFDPLESPTESSAEEDDGGRGDNDDDNDDDDQGNDNSGRAARSDRVLRSDTARAESHERQPLLDRSASSDQMERFDGPDRPDRPDRSADRHDRSPRASLFRSVRKPSGSDEGSSTIDDRAKTPPSCRGLLTFEFKDQKQVPNSSGCQDGPSTSGSSKFAKKITERKMLTERNLPPTEFAIYLGGDGPHTADMMEVMSDIEKAQSSSDEEDNTETSKEQKRKKLDSGIGEGTTTSSGSSPHKTDSNCDETDSEVMRSDSLSDENMAGCSRRQKRGHQSLGHGSTSSSEHSGEESEGVGAESRARGRRKRRAAVVVTAAPEPHGARRRPGGPDARRVRLSILMKRGVKELPLPYALKKYVNYGRCFEF